MTLIISMYIEKHVKIYLILGPNKHFKSSMPQTYNQCSLKFHHMMGLNFYIPQKTEVQFLKIVTLNSSPRIIPSNN